jgi:hypothetical protein
VTAQVEGGQLETPQGWRDLSRLQQGLFFRQGDGIVVPAFDETGAPLQVGLIVLKVRPELSLDQAAQDVERGEAAGNTPAGETRRERIQLDDGTQAILITRQLIKDGERRKLQLHLLARAPDQDIVVVSAYAVASINSDWPVPGSFIADWLGAHLLTLRFDARPANAHRLQAAYDRLAGAADR